MRKQVLDIIQQKAYNLYPGDHSGYQISKANGFINGATWSLEIAKSIYEETLNKYGLDISTNNFEEKLIDKWNERDKQ